jgi:PAS domain S-box-containing protein
MSSIANTSARRPNFKKETERRSRSRSSRYAGNLRVVHDALNSSASGVIMTDRDAKIIYVNPSFLKIFGYRKKTDVLYRNAADLFTRDEIKKFFDVNEIIGEARGGTEEFFARHRNGTIFPVEVSSSIVTDSNGSVLGRMASFIDITERKRFEDELKKSERQLRTLSRKLLESQELEKKRIARELHDGLGASLTSIKFSLERYLDNHPKERESLEQAVSLVQQAIKDTSRISRSLRPSILDDMGVIPAIRCFCRGFQEVNSGIQVDTQLELEEAEIPDALKIAIYRIVQEALTNVAKHSGAQRVTVVLAKTDGSLVLSIGDDGRGFDSMEQLSKANGSDNIPGMGLSSMKERAELSGGTIAIMPLKGSGTIIHAKWLNPTRPNHPSRMHPSGSRSGPIPDLH